MRVRTSPDRQRSRSLAGLLVLALALVVILAASAVVALGLGRGSATFIPPQGAATSATSASPTSAASATAAAEPSCDPGPWDCAQRTRFEAATALMRRQTGHINMIVRDRRTGAVWRAGEPTYTIWAGSTPKLAVAATLLEQARAGEITLDPKARSQLDAMLAVSDNDAADALWNRYIHPVAFMQRLRDRYGMRTATYVNGFPSRWGFIKCTSSDLAALMSYILERLDAEDRAYLVHAMRTVGAIQKWGVWSAGASLRPGVKDGWSQEQDAGRTHWITATVGFAGPDERYVVAAMYHQLPGGDTIEHGVRMLSDLVATVFGAPVPAPVVIPDNQ